MAGATVGGMTPRQRIESAWSYQQIVWLCGGDTEERAAGIAEAEQVIAEAQAQMVEGPL